MISENRHKGVGMSEAITKLNVLDVYEINHHSNLCLGILLSRDLDYEWRDKTGEENYYWDVALSYKGMGCQVAKLTDEEVLRGKFLGTVGMFDRASGLENK